MIGDRWKLKGKSNPVHQIRARSSAPRSSLVLWVTTRELCSSNQTPLFTILLDVCDSSDPQVLRTRWHGDAEYLTVERVFSAQYVGRGRHDREDGLAVDSIDVHPCRWAVVRSPEAQILTCNLPQILICTLPSISIITIILIKIAQYISNVESHLHQGVCHLNLFSKGRKGWQDSLDVCTLTDELSRLGFNVRNCLPGVYHARR